MTTNNPTTLASIVNEIVNEAIEKEWGWLYHVKLLRDAAIAGVPYEGNIDGATAENKPFWYFEYYVTAGWMHNAAHLVKAYVSGSVWQGVLSDACDCHLGGARPEEDPQTAAVMAKVENRINAYMDDYNRQDREDAQEAWHEAVAEGAIAVVRSARRQLRLKFMADAAACALLDPEGARRLREQAAAIK